MGFFSVLSIVIGSQLGSSIFVLPSSLAPYGSYGLSSWWITGIGAVLLALVFAELSMKTTKTGGPHVFIEAALGKTAAFYAGWTYWLVSWMSSCVVVMTGIGFLAPIIGEQSAGVQLLLELVLLLVITLVNCKSIRTASQVEVFLTAIKYGSLIVLPLFTFSYFDSDNIQVLIPETPPLKIVGNVAMIAFWGFIGVESATVPAGSVSKPTRIIPLATVVGTICVALLYFIDCLAIMGMLDAKLLSQTSTAHSLAIERIWGTGSGQVMAALASFICIGTLNAWTITSGQIALGLSKDGFLPAIFGKTNREGAPYSNILMSSAGIALLLFLTQSKSMMQQITAFIDISVNAFLFIYLLCCVAFLKLLPSGQYVRKAVGLGAASFCVFVIYSTDLSTLALVALFPLSGLALRKGRPLF
jgi:APA family basic amino acid/polyamine antiporter